MPGFRNLIMTSLLFAPLAGTAHAAPQPIITFFSEWSAAIDDPAQQAVAHAAELAKAQPGTPVSVHGYADTTGSAAANRLLSQLRAQVVTDLLVQDGVPPDTIKQAGEGETEAPGIKQESRRAEITIGAQ